MDDPSTETLAETPVSPPDRDLPVSPTEPGTASLGEPAGSDAQVSTEGVSTTETVENSALAAPPIAHAKNASTGPRKTKRVADISVANASIPAPITPTAQAGAATAKNRHVPKLAPKKSSNFPVQTKSNVLHSQEKIMTKEFDANVASVGAEIQDKVRSALKKGTALISELGVLTKGNLQAATESGRILRKGLGQLGTDYVADGHAMFDTLSADAREIAAVKSPIDFFKLQGEFARRNFEAALEFGRKNNDAILKLAQDASAPLARQAEVAMETVGKVA